MARSLKFRIKVEEELYYPYSENKGANQLYSYCKADLRLCSRIGCRQQTGFLLTRLNRAIWNPGKNKIHITKKKKQIFSAVKIEILLEKNDIFNIFPQNINCGYTFEPPPKAVLTSTHNLCFGSKNKKIRYTAVTPTLLYKSGVYGGIYYTDMSRLS